MLTLNSKTIEQEFGLQSRFFKDFHESAFDLLEQKDHPLQHSFKDWLQDFQSLQPQVSTQALKELYIRHSYLASLLMTFFSRTLSSDNKRKDDDESFSLSYSKLFSQKYFKWTTSHPMTNKISKMLESHYIFAPEDLFRDLYLHLLTIEERTTLGEFYTPPFLARAMIDHSFRVGQVVLDPACGSGIFLVEILKKILHQGKQSSKSTSQQDTILSIFGFDVNPLAVATTRTNLALLLWNHQQPELIPKLLNNVQQVDFLEENNPIIHSLKGNVDLVIGNPPWLVLNHLSSKSAKLRFKTLARKFHLLPPPHLVSNLELSALFLYRAKHVLRPRGWVFFVVSNGFMVGDNHVGTRQFIEFDNIEAWKFSTDMFRIHNICLLAQYIPRLYRTRQELENLRITVKKFRVIRCQNDPTTKDRNSTLQLEPMSSEIYVPYAVDNKPNDDNSGFHVKKLIPVRMKKNLLPRGESHYHPLCFNGAVISPRNLLFVSVTGEFTEHDKRFVTIIPTIENPKKRWNFNPLTELGWKHATVEKKFIHHVVKSVDLVPFLVLKYRTVFLPIEIDEDMGGYRLTSDRDSKGWHYFRMLDQLYRKHQKPDASLPTLWQNIDYQGKLTASRQRAPHKIVIQSGGTRVKAAVVSNPNIIIDHACFFIGLNDVNEARYLCAILNAPMITHDVNIRQAEGARGSGRSIKKRPLEIAIPRFNPSHPVHVALSRQAQKMEQVVKKEVDKFLKSRKTPLKSVVKIQKHVYETLHAEFEHLDKLVKELWM